MFIVPFPLLCMILLFVTFVKFNVPFVPYIPALCHESPERVNVEFFISAIPLLINVL